MPDACFAYYDAFALHDQTTGVLTFAREESADDCKLDRLRGVLLAGEIEEAATGPLITGPLTSDTSEEDFCKSVQRALDYLAAGDIFQVNVSQEISGRWARGARRSSARI
jgi:para-aminobenzoate synthetase component 1